MTEKRDTYKYNFKVGNLKVHCGITNNLVTREQQHRNSGRYTLHGGRRYYWRNGNIVQVGNITTRQAAMDWEKINNCNKNWN